MNKLPPQTTRGQYEEAYRLIRAFMKQGMVSELEIELSVFQRGPVWRAWQTWEQSLVFDPLWAGSWRSKYGVDNLPF